MTKKIQNIIEQIKRDVIIAQTSNDKTEKAYNEGLARGRISALYNIGAFDEADLINWTNFVNKNI